MWGKAAGHGIGTAVHQPQPFDERDRRLTTRADKGEHHESVDDGHTHDNDASRSGETVDEAVATAEAGSQVEGVHTPSG